jgi:hypothetical protein
MSSSVVKHTQGAGTPPESQTSNRPIRLSVLCFEDLEKSTMAYVFFRIANLNNDYPML